MRKLLTVIVLMVLAQGCYEKKLKDLKSGSIFSPNGKCVFHFIKGESDLTCKLQADGNEILSSIPISIVIDDIQYPGTAKIIDLNIKDIKKEITPTVSTITSLIKIKSFLVLGSYD